MYFVFFFFQAEDGIRDLTVTGVQTCALPIFRMRGDLSGLQHNVATELKSVSTEVTHQLQEGMKLIQTAQTTMGDRLDHAARVVGEVQGSLGKLGEATLRVVEV